jgi:hypothetical protein
VQPIVKWFVVDTNFTYVKFETNLLMGFPFEKTNGDHTPQPSASCIDFHPIQTRMLPAE